jgi:hypothetical protein
MHIQLSRLAVQGGKSQCDSDHDSSQRIAMNTNRFTLIALFVDVFKYDYNCWSERHFKIVSDAYLRFLAVC